MLLRFWLCLCLWRLIGCLCTYLVDKEVSVNTGDSVTLDSGFDDVMDFDNFVWKFGKKSALIAKLYKWPTRLTVHDDVLDGKFRNRLKVEKHTGSLTITNITTEDTGDYVLSNIYTVTVFTLKVYDEVKETLSVNEGDSVTLDSSLTELKEGDKIEWRFLKAVIATTDEWYHRNIEDVLDGRFRNRLTMDEHTGSLTITNITTEHAGIYNRHTNNVIKLFTLVFFEQKEVSVNFGDSVTLETRLTEPKDDGLIQWRFGHENTLIAQINVTTGRSTVYDDVLDGRFRNRLKLNKQTGSLTVTNITTEDAGRYELKTTFLDAVFILEVYDSVHCCGPTEAVIRLVLSALVGVTTVILLVYEIRSRRAGDRAQIHTSRT